MSARQVLTKVKQAFARQEAQRYEREFWVHLVRDELGLTTRDQDDKWADPTGF